MVERGGFCFREQRSHWESSTLRNCPVEDRQGKFLHASLNPYSVSNCGLNGFEFSGIPERGLMHEANGLMGKSVSHSQTQLLTPNEYLEERSTLFPARFDAQTSQYRTPPQQKKFLIFDQSGNETRLMFSSLCPRVQDLTAPRAMHSLRNQQAAPAPLSGANQFLEEGQFNKAEQAFIKPHILYEESGENETVNEDSEMREDTEEIDALLYSDYGDGFDTNFYSEHEDDDEVSTGHSPSGNFEEVQDFDEVASIDRSSKRQKALDDGWNKLPLLWTATMGTRNVSCENKHEELITLDEGMSPTIGNKRSRKDKICDTLKVLESIIPGVKSKDPLVILDETISYLKSLKSDAETMSMEDPDTPSCYGPSN